jgi:hypothetical protein
MLQFQSEKRKNNVNQIKSEIESRLCLISSEAFDIGVCFTTILKTHVRISRAHEWNIVGLEKSRGFLLLTVCWHFRGTRILGRDCLLPSISFRREAVNGREWREKLENMFVG